MSRIDAPRTCPACESPPERSFTLSNGLPLLRCPRCRMGWWEWPAFDPAGFYDRDYFQSSDAAKGYDDYASLEPGLRRTARVRLARLSRLLATSAAARPDGPIPVGGVSILDVGCGTGAFLDEARALGWQTQGIEVSVYAAQAAQQRGLEVRCEPIDRASLRGAAYDCVTLWDVLEHLCDPAGVLAAAAAAVRPGGVVAVSTGDITSLCARISGRRWHLFNLPEHLYFFSRRSLELLMQRSGLRVARIVREVYWSPFSYLIERMLKSALPARRRRSWLRRTMIPATLWDVLGVYALKEVR
jgi:SAM-dependent methyltransferase